MPNTTVNLVKGTIEPGTCFSSVQALYDLVIDSTTAHVKGEYSLFNFGNTVPAVSDQDKPWIRTIGNAPDKIYVYESGYWLSRHPVPVDSYERRIWTGTTAQLAEYDGAAAGSCASTATSFTGPFWEVDPDFSAVFPVGVGEFASGAEVSNGGTGGEDKTTLTSSQVPDHKHLGEAFYRASSSSTYTTDPTGIADQTLHENKGHTTNASFNVFSVAGVRTTSIEGGAGESHDNLPPYRGVYFIKRTIRQFYTAG